MNVFLNTPGIIEFELRPGDQIIGRESKMTHCDEGVKFGKVEPAPAPKKLFSLFQKKEYLVRFTNIVDSNQFIIFNYEDAKYLNKIEIFDLRKIHSDLVFNFSTFFAATIGVALSDFDKKNALSSLGLNKIERKIAKGNGTIFLCKRKDRTLTKIQLEKGKSLIINPEEVFAFSKSSMQEAKVKTVKGLGLHFVGPGEVFIYARE